MHNLILLFGIIAVQSLGGFSMLIPANDEFPRHSEGSIIELEDGTILLAWTRFTGGGADHAEAHIAAMTSKDGGKTWSEPYVIQENTGEQNVMSVSLLRLKSDKIGMWYLEKNSNSDLQVYARFSDDEAKTWSPPQKVTPDEGYNIMNNDRVIQTSTGRIICPISYTKEIWRAGPLEVFCVYSDDDGETWHKSVPIIKTPGERGAMEPGVVELANGDLLMIIRTQVGCIYTSISKNKGMTWTQAEPSDIVSPESPATVKRIPGSRDLLLIWNNNFEEGAGHSGKRTPLTAAISKDNGKTWEYVKNIETNPEGSYAYTSIAFMKNQVLLTYYEHTPELPRWSLRFSSIPLEKFYAND